MRFPVLCIPRDTGVFLATKAEEVATTRVSKELTVRIITGMRIVDADEACFVVRSFTEAKPRAPEVAARIVPGHWEGDLIKGAGGHSAIGTLVERTSRYVMLVRLDGCSAQQVLDGFSRRLRSIPPELRKTMTYDQGSEMALHKTLSKKLRMDVYFCDAYKPWQRGSNENANGIIRRFLPKGIDLSPFTDKNLADLEFVLNNTPRKILGFKTPHEIFSGSKSTPSPVLHFKLESAHTIPSQEFCYASIHKRLCTSGSSWQPHRRDVNVGI